MGHGFDGSANYGVAYPDGTMWGEALEISVGAEPCVIPGFYVTNTAWAVDAILNSDGYTEGAFKAGDYFKVTVHGLDAEGNVISTRDFCLADYRFEQEADRYYLDDWTYIDLTPLGEVSAVKFTFDGSRGNAYGLTTPCYFCLDNFGADGTETPREEGTYTGESLVSELDAATAAPKAIFTIQGVRVYDMSSPGLYIVDGKKVLVK